MSNQFENFAIESDVSEPEIVGKKKRPRIPRKNKVDIISESKKIKTRKSIDQLRKEVLGDYKKTDKEDVDNIGEPYLNMEENFNPEYESSGEELEDDKLPIRQGLGARYNNVAYSEVPIQSREFDWNKRHENLKTINKLKPTKDGQPHGKIARFWRNLTRNFWHNPDKEIERGDYTIEDNINDHLNHDQ